MIYFWWGVARLSWRLDGQCQNTNNINSKLNAFRPGVTTYSQRERIGTPFLGPEI